MRKILLGLAATAAIASPLALAASAQAVTADVAIPANPLSAPVCNVLPTPPTGPANVQWSAVTDHRALNGKVGISATPAPGHTFTNGTTTKAYAAQACLFGAPTVENGVPVYGAYANGTWKIGSKVTLESGTEFLTHGGATSDGPLLRYRLVFTPNAGFTLPSTLPGDGFKVGGSAVFHVYVSVPYEFHVTDAPNAGKHINLPDAFSIEHSADGFPGYYSTQIKVLVFNDTNVAKNIHLMYADQQDGNRVWIERVLYTDGLPGEVVPAHSSRLAVFDVWYDAPVTSPADVPDDLVFDFGI